ncbi:MAG TPA: galactokinase [Gemmatimonadales bacterium]|nr:galactokinase [Gemmatimonadales bacterium]
MSAPLREATSLFQAAFASDPAVLASAPGRVNLLGEHTDYNGGPVLPMALQRRTVVAAAPGPEWQAVSDLSEMAASFDPAATRTGQWTDYLAAVAAELIASGVAVSPMRIAVASNLPVGAGLSSSAALCVAAARAMVQVSDRRFKPSALAETAFRAEHDRVGVRCGRMDQTIAAEAMAEHAMLFDTGSGRVEQLPMPWTVWLIETGVSRRLTEGAYNQRRAECDEALLLLQERWPGLRKIAALPAARLDSAMELLPPPLDRRVRHVVTETARTFAAAQALSQSDRAALGRLMIAGHMSLKNDYQSSCLEADSIVTAAQEAGADGARLTGAGWGGTVLMLADEVRAGEIIRAVRLDFRRRFSRSPVVWRARAGVGVRGHSL